MEIPACFDPERQERLRQARLERRRGAFGRCDGCGGSLLDFETCTELAGRLYCEGCVNAGRRFLDRMG